jgi:phage terminase small subunit
MLRMLVQFEEGTPSWGSDFESLEWKRLKKDLIRSKWLDDMTLEMACVKYPQVRICGLYRRSPLMMHAPNDLVRHTKAVH